MLLAFFHAHPQIDLDVAAAFFTPQTCDTPGAASRVCGGFPHRGHPLLSALPATTGVYLLYRLMQNFQQHGATYCWRRKRDYSIALTALLVGP